MLYYRYLRNFSTILSTRARSKRRRWTMPPPPPPPGVRSLKWQAWKLQAVRDIEKYGLHFQFNFHNPNSANYKVNTKPRSLSVCRLVPKSQNIDTWPHYTVIFKRSTLDKFGKDNCHAPYCQLKRLLYFICHKTSLFRDMFSLESSASALLWCLLPSPRFSSYRPHIYFDRKSIRCNKIHIFKIKVIRVKSIFV